MWRIDFKALKRWRTNFQMNRIWFLSCANATVFTPVLQNVVLHSDVRNSWRVRTYICLLISQAIYANFVKFALRHSNGCNFRLLFMWLVWNSVHIHINNWITWTRTCVHAFNFGCLLFENRIVFKIPIA